MSQELITDIKKLFRFSGMLDSLRDTTKNLCDIKDVDVNTIISLNNRYNFILDEVKSTINEELQSEFAKFSEKTEDNISLPHIYFLASQMSQYLELLHQTPDFLLSKQVRDANVVEISEAIENKFGKKELVQFGFNV